MMEQSVREELLATVNDMLAQRDVLVVASTIQDAHLGRPDGVFVTPDNLHLFRQYRNNVSANPYDLTNEAIEWAKVQTADC